MLCSLGCHSEFPSRSLRFHLDVTSNPLRGHFEFTWVSLLFHCDLMSISLQFHFESGSGSHRFNFNFCSASLRPHSGFAVLSRRFLFDLNSIRHFVFTSISLRFQFGYILISLRVHLDGTAASLQAHFRFTSISFRCPFNFTSISTRLHKRKRQIVCCDHIQDLQRMMGLRVFRSSTPLASAHDQQHALQTQLNNTSELGARPRLCSPRWVVRTKDMRRFCSALDKS